ncbi:MAG TPA: A24 family peptidase [Thermoanaerobaculia bacterium]|nr:A24 family peptidase [Thermoanaerobaculia bacterium]
MTPLLIPVAAVAGLLVGSFVNVVIHRVPLGRSIVFPGSHCPRCGAPIRAFDNVPVVSWLFLGGKCRTCRGPISPRYPLIELANGFLWLAAARAALSPVDFAAAAIFSSACLALVFIDFDWQILPDAITLPLAAAGLAFSFFSPRLGWKQSLAGIVAGGASLWLVAFVYEKTTGREGMGLGDVKMLGAIGAFTGVAGVITTVLFASLAGSVVGLLLMAVKGGGWKTRLPFGVFLGAAGVAAFWAGTPLWVWYRGLLR